MNDVNDAKIDRIVANLFRGAMSVVDENTRAKLLANLTELSHCIGVRQNDEDVDAERMAKAVEEVLRKA